MKFNVIAVGKLKERFWSDACAEYLKRLQPYAKTTVTEIPDIDPARVGGEAAALQRESETLLRAIPERAYVVLLAIDGKELSSEQLSEHIDDLGLSGTSEVYFVIGGSCGVSPEVRSRANETLSFGRITLPHNLARVVLLEQLYRACKISKGEPYHK